MSASSSSGDASAASAIPADPNHVWVTLSVNGSASSQSSNYGEISYNQLEAALNKEYPTISSFKVTSPVGIVCHPDDASLGGGTYNVTISTEGR